MLSVCKSAASGIGFKGGFAIGRPKTVAGRNAKKARRPIAMAAPNFSNRRLASRPSGMMMQRDCAWTVQFCARPLAVLMEQPNQAGLNPRKGKRFASIIGQIDTGSCGERFYLFERFRICIPPKRPQLTQKDVHRYRPDAVKCEEPRLEVLRAFRTVMKLRHPTAIIFEKRMAHAQHLVRLAPIIAHIAAFSHDRVHEKIPAGVHDLLRRGQATANERSISVARNRPADPRAKEQTCQQPTEQCAFSAARESDAEFLGKQWASL